MRGGLGQSLLPSSHKRSKLLLALSKDEFIPYILIAPSANEATFQEGHKPNALMPKSQPPVTALCDQSKVALKGIS